MRKIQKLLIGTFLGGILLGGIGTGMAFAEYSTFSYAGEKRIGDQNLVTRELDFSFDPADGRIRIPGGYWEQRLVEGIETDESVPEGTVRFVVTYNEKQVAPYLEFWEEESEELEPDESETEELETVALEPAGLEPEESEPEKTEPAEAVSVETADPAIPVRIQGELCLQVRSIGSGLELFMEGKSEVLKDFKERQIASYSTATITGIVIRVNPGTMPYIADGIH